MKQIICLITVSAGLAIPTAHAASIVEIHSFTVGTGIPDGNPSGLADLQSLTTAISLIEDISVTLEIAGTFNGDLYVTLQHESGFAVLLNGIGRTASDAFGFGDDGVQITLNDLGGFSDIHTQTTGGGTLTSPPNFGSDGRTTDPDLVVAGDSRDALLDGFVGLDANGGWTLFVADLSGGDEHTLNSWGMEITGVPEPANATLLVLGAALLGRRRR